jgi:hypothetical protein
LAKGFGEPGTHLVLERIDRRVVDGDDGDLSVSTQIDAGVDIAHLHLPPCRSFESRPIGPVDEGLESDVAPVPAGSARPSCAPAPRSSPASTPRIASPLDPHERAPRCGYGQRIEVLGSNGALRAGNVALSTVAFAGAEGIVGDKPLPFFLERYAEAYRLELDHFVDAHPWHAAAARRQRRGQGVGAGGRRVAVAADRPHHRPLPRSPVKAGKQGEFSIRR